MKTDLEHIMTFTKVAELNSFTKAADALNLSRSVISKHISALEYSLKVQLFKRSTRKLTITEAGKIFYQQTRSLEGQIENARLSVHAMQSQPQGRLKVISPANLISSIKKEVVPDYLKTYPEVILNIESVRPARDYVDKEFDIIILWKLNIDRFPDYNLIAVKFLDVGVGLYASPEYLKEYGIPKTPNDLHQHNCFSSIGKKWPFTKKDGNVDYLYVKGNLITNNEEMIQSAVVNGMGIAYSYPFLFEDELQSGQVVPVLQEYTKMQIEVYAFYHPMQFELPKITRFIDKLKQHFRDR